MPDTKHWLYRLRLNEPAKLTTGFNEIDTATMSRHRAYLAQLTEAGLCTLAGRTDAGEQTFGLVIFVADDAESARCIMTGDPAVSEGLMQAELLPFLLAFKAGA